MCDRIIILKHSSIWQQCANNSKNFIIEDIKIVISSNAASDVNDRTCQSNHNETSSMLHCRNVLRFFISKPSQEQCGRWLIESYHIPPIIKPSVPTQLSVDFRYHEFQNCSIFMNFNFQDLRCTPFVETVLRKWVLNFSATFATIVLNCLVTVLFNVRRFVT